MLKYILVLHAERKKKNFCVWNSTLHVQKQAHPYGACTYTETLALLYIIILHCFFFSLACYRKSVVATWLSSTLVFSIYIHTLTPCYPFFQHIRVPHLFLYIYMYVLFKCFWFFNHSYIHWIKPLMVNIIPQVDN